MINLGFFFLFKKNVEGIYLRTLGGSLFSQTQLVAALQRKW